MAFARSSKIAPIHVLSDQVRLLHRSTDDSPSQMSVMVVDVPPGGFVPPHRHACEEEGYYVLAGELDLTIGGQTRRLEAGDFGHVPPQVTHGYANAGQTAVRFLAWTVGGPIDEFFEVMSSRVKQMPRDASIMGEIAERFGIALEAGAQHG